MDKRNLKIVLLFVACILSIVAFALFGAPFISLKLGDLSNNVSGFQLAFDFDKNYCNSDFGFFGPLISLCSTFGFMLCSIISTLMILISKNLPQTENLSIKKITINIAILLASGGVSMLLNFLVVEMCGFSDNPLASLGSGAIASSLIHFTACSITTFSYVIK